MFFTYNLSKSDLLNHVHFKDPFLKEVLNIWTEVNFEPQLKSVEHFHSQTLFSILTGLGVALFKSGIC